MNLGSKVSSDQEPFAIQEARDKQIRVAIGAEILVDLLDSVDDRK